MLTPLEAFMVGLPVTSGGNPPRQRAAEGARMKHWR
jgi:hypothetical protein